MRVLFCVLGLVGSAGMFIWVPIAATVTSMGDSAGSLFTFGKVDNAFSKDPSMGLVQSHTGLLMVLSTIAFFVCLVLLILTPKKKPE
ncbi:hypothetical protein ACP2AV_14720 [Aliiroseovarius sp. PTFE2010]|uniref:hypothetical protein n=1 Tax=Aliiroseovarius sp. PTFE2010 TaxID=3417190 RepID=UPI003CF7C369